MLLFIVNIQHNNTETDSRPLDELIAFIEGEGEEDGDNGGGGGVIVGMTTTTTTTTKAGKKKKKVKKVHVR